MQAVIFDMDGVLVDSEPIHQRTELDALAAFGLPLQVEDLYPYAGTTREAFQEGLTREYNFHPDWKALFQHKDRRFYEMMEEVEALPGVLRFIQELKQEGFKLALATSGQKRCADFVLEKFSLQPLFDAVVCANDVRQSKPDPEIFLIAADRLQAAPVDCVVFEDSINGLRAAKSAGMYAIGITGTFNSSALYEADRIIHHFGEIDAHQIRLCKKRSE